MLELDIFTLKPILIHQFRTLVGMLEHMKTIKVDEEVHGFEPL